MHINLKAEPVSNEVYARVSRAAESIRAKTGHAPTLATVLVGVDPASQVYVKRKGEMAAKLGMGHRDYKFEANISQDLLMDTVRKLNADPEVDGILVQRPLPKHLDESKVFDLIDPTKDVDCFSPHNVGLLVQGRCKLLPCTPAGIMEIIRHYKIEITGKNALVVGRSDIVGKPMAMLLLHSHATVTTAHSKTRDLAACVAEADIIVAAIGRVKFMTGNLPWKKSAVVIDVGINRNEASKLCGDVDFDAVAPKVAAITPVPGGVGPMTIAMLMVNTVRAALMRKNIMDEV
ncbi:MAG: bifunctional 5,10-methylenetetrahydrofolate dehydrogenase/5,10-methenyltetrahydrofolate cyclohydrolase [Deltaproteobacteria bacterium]|nr:bifunctional 5,10-methylenetetrahydrofolate dehydrogenase/5,10-methenyltetrahydrofolate cyclohydrolase [Deltaproteobacteria bacterium]